jgi:hypothetical protein
VLVGLCQRQASTFVWPWAQGVAVAGQLLTVVAPTAEHWPLLAQKHDPPLVLAAVQHTLPEQEPRLPLA